MEILKFALILNLMSHWDRSMILTCYCHLFDVRLAQQSGVSCGICQQVLL